MAAPANLLETVDDSRFNDEKNFVIHDLCGSVDSGDKSRKGSFDRELGDILPFLNSLPFFVTTSSCSGRVIIFSQSPEGKGSCHWHMVSHSEFSTRLLIEAVTALKASVVEESRNAVLKFEPFILHVRCRNLAVAQVLHSVSVQSGFRNSGITIRRKGKEGHAVHVAVRCTLNFEMPITINGDFVIRKESVEAVGGVLEAKMHRNTELISRFLLALKQKFSDVSPVEKDVLDLSD